MRRLSHSLPLLEAVLWPRTVSLSGNAVHTQQHSPSAPFNAGSSGWAAAWTGRHISTCVPVRMPRLRARPARGPETATTDTPEGQTYDDGVTDYEGTLPAEILQALRPKIGDKAAKQKGRQDGHQTRSDMKQGTRGAGADTPGRQGNSKTPVPRTNPLLSPNSPREERARQQASQPAAARRRDSPYSSPRAADPTKQRTQPSYSQQSAGHGRDASDGSPRAAASLRASDPIKQRTQPSYSQQSAGRTWRDAPGSAPRAADPIKQRADPSEHLLNAAAAQVSAQDSPNAAAPAAMHALWDQRPDSVTANSVTAGSVTAGSVSAESGKTRGSVSDTGGRARGGVSDTGGKMRGRVGDSGKQGGRGLDGPMFQGRPGSSHGGEWDDRSNGNRRGDAWDERSKDDRSKDRDRDTQGRRGSYDNGRGMQQGGQGRRAENIRGDGVPFTGAGKGDKVEGDWGYVNMRRGGSGYRPVLPAAAQIDMQTSKKVTRCVDDCKTVEQLEAMAGRLERLDGVAHSRLLWRLANLKDRSKAASPQPELDAFSSRVLLSILPQVGGLSSRNLTTVLHSAAKLSVTDAAFLQLMVTHVERAEVQAAMNDADRHSLLWALATLGIDLQPTVMRSTVQGLLQAQSLGSQTVSVALWALAKRSFNPGPDIVQRLLTKLEHCDDWSSQSVVNLAWALGVLEHTPTPAVAKALAQHMTESLNDYQSHAAASTLDSLRLCNAVTDVATLDRLVHAINAKATSFSTAQLASIDSAVMHLTTLAGQQLAKAAAV